MLFWKADPFLCKNCHAEEPANYIIASPFEFKAQAGLLQLIKGKWHILLFLYACLVGTSPSFLSTKFVAVSAVS